MLRKIKTFIFLLCLSSLLSACGTTLPPSHTIYTPHKSHRSTVQHTVAPGETLWRISKIYDVSLDSILNANHLNPSSPIQMGQKLIIPRANKPSQVFTPYPSNKWKYIIIHHSATDQGSSLAFHKSHLAKGWDRDVGYHFIINNGHGEKADGFIEVSPRWLKQQDGAHCKASDMNTKAIGICLVGNFNQDKMTRAQMDSLVDLVSQLQKYYHIPDDHVMGHGQVHGSSTECPGKSFPWTEFNHRLHRR